MATFTPAAPAHDWEACTDPCCNWAVCRPAPTTVQELRALLALQCHCYANDWVRRSILEAPSDAEALAWAREHISGGGGGGPCKRDSQRYYWGYRCKRDYIEGEVTERDQRTVVVTARYTYRELVRSLRQGCEQLTLF